MARKWLPHFNLYVEAFFTSFFEKTGDSVVHRCVRKIVPTFPNVLKWGPEENLRLGGPVKENSMKNHPNEFHPSNVVKYRQLLILEIFKSTSTIPTNTWPKISGVRRECSVKSWPF